MVNTGKKKCADKAKQNSNPYSAIIGCISFSWFCRVLTYPTCLVVGQLESFQFSLRVVGDHFGVKALLSSCFFKPCFFRSEISGSKVLDPDCQMTFGNSVPAGAPPSIG